MRVVELFSGIGSQARALKKLAVRNNFNLEVTNICEWNIHAFTAYNLIHNDNLIADNILKMSKEELLMELSKYNLSSNGKELISPSYLRSLSVDLLRMIYNALIATNNLVDITGVKGSDIPNDTDLLTYSFPCQDLSNVGSLHGYNQGIDRDANTRSGLLWQVERILNEKHQNNDPLPRFLLLENVNTLESSRHIENFNIWKERLVNLGYVNKIYRLNASDFGIPQNRKRLMMLSVFVGDNEGNRERITKFWQQNDLNSPAYREVFNIHRRTLRDYLKLEYKVDKYLHEALSAQPNETASRLEMWEDNSVIYSADGVFSNKVQTITTKQDRNPNSGNIYFNPENNKARYRFLTPRECFTLMGFEEKDYEVLINNNLVTRGKSQFFSRDIIYKLAGNSIVVDVLEHIFNQMLEINRMI